MSAVGIVSVNLVAGPGEREGYIAAPGAIRARADDGSPATIAPPERE
jgi:hypothetical protein